MGATLSSISVSLGVSQDATITYYYWGNCHVNDYFRRYCIYMGYARALYCIFRLKIKDLEMEEEITVAEAALLYGCSHTNMSYLVATKRLPSTRQGRFIMLKRADVIALREQRDTRERSNAWIEGVKHGAA